MLLNPPPDTNCHSFSDPLPFERDVLYGRFLVQAYIQLIGLFTLLRLSLSMSFCNGTRWCSDICSVPCNRGVAGSNLHQATA